MSDELTPSRRVTRSMTMKTGSFVCEEVKLSALLKATRICEKKRVEEGIKLEFEMRTQEEEKSKSKNSLSSSMSPSKFDEADTALNLKQSSDVVDLASNKRRQLEDLENNRQIEVEEAVNKKAAQLRAHSLKIRAALEERARQREKERLEEEAAIKAELDELDNVERNRTTLVLQLQAKLNSEHEKKIEKIIEEAGKIDMKRREELKLKKELLEKIAANQHKFRETYQQISDSLKTFPYREEIVGGGTIVQEVSAIKNLTGMMETLCKQCKVGEVSNLDLNTSDNLVQNLEAGFAAVKAKLDIIRANKDSAVQEQPEIKNEIPSPVPISSAVELPKTDSVSTPASFQPEKLATALAAPVTGLEGYISKSNLEELTRLQNLLEAHLSNLKPLETDASLKKYRFQLQMSINTPLNAVSAVNASHLKDKLQRLQAVLRGQHVEVGNSKVSASSHPNGVAFCTNLLAERIVDQGEQIVSSKPESAFPVAAVALALWAEFPLFGELLLAHFYSKCPFLVPYYAPRTSGTSDKDFYRSQGYAYDSEGKIESHDKYLKRMTGTAHLFFAIMTSKLPRDISAQPPLTTARVWKWIASLLNLDPRPDISATVLLACLEVAGNSLAATYKKQFIKLFLAVTNDYFSLIRQLSPNSVSGPISRLEIYLTKAVNGFAFPPPPGALPQHFW